MKESLEEKRREVTIEADILAIKFEAKNKRIDVEKMKSRQLFDHKLKKKKFREDVVDE